MYKKRLLAVLFSMIFVTLIGAITTIPVLTQKSSLVRSATNINYYFELNKKVHPGEGTTSIGRDVLIIDQDLMVVSTFANGGEIYIFDRNIGGDENWGLAKKLTDSLDELVLPIGLVTAALDGNTLVVGSENYDDYQGVVFVFERNRGGVNNWGLTKMIESSSLSQSSEYFGQTIAISGDTVVVVASVGFQTNGAYVFEQDRGGEDNWGETTLIEEPTTDIAFGEQEGVAIEGDTVIISAGLGNGPVLYVFERDQGGVDNWGQVGELDDGFGSHLAIDGDTFVAGNPGYNGGVTDPEGAAFIYQRNLGLPAHWEKITMLQDPEGNPTSDNFGASVVIDGDIVVVGNSSTWVDHSNQGAVVVFDRNAGGTNNWGVTARLTDPNGRTNDFFGATVSFSGNTLAIGASGDDDFGYWSGAVHVYEKDDYKSIFLPLVVK